jgi:hypothetical protein
MLKILNSYDIGYFLTLDEPEYTIIRVEAPRETAQKVRSTFEFLKSPLFNRVTVNTWSPFKDARLRILSAKVRAGLSQVEEGWKIVGKDSAGNWQAAPEELVLQQQAFVIFMS